MEKPASETHVKVYAIADDLRPGRWQVIAEVDGRYTRQLDFGLSKPAALRVIRTAHRTAAAIGACLVA